MTPGPESCRQNRARVTAIASNLPGIRQPPWLDATNLIENDADAAALAWAHADTRGPSTGLTTWVGARSRPRSAWPIARWNRNSCGHRGLTSGKRKRPSSEFLVAAAASIKRKLMRQCLQRLLLARQKANFNR
jgi:hypothetical protein